MHPRVVHHGLGRHNRGTRAADGGFIRFHPRRKRVGVAAHLLGLIFGNDARLEKPPVTIGLRLRVLLLGRVTDKIGLGLAQRRLILRQVGFHLIHHGVERARIDGEQQVARLHKFAFVKVHLGDLAAHLRLHRNGGIGLDISDDFDLQRHVPLGG